MGLYTILNATGQTINVTGLDGDLHGTYAVDGMLNMTRSPRPTSRSSSMASPRTSTASAGMIFMEPSFRAAAR